MGFTPHYQTPLVVSFIEMMRELGYATRFSFDFWDFYVYDNSEKPALALKTVKNTVTEAVMERLLVDKTPLKVLLVEGQNPSFPNFDKHKLFLATTGTGLYVRNVGWQILPGKPVAETVENLQLRLARRWSQLEDGSWVKNCTKCGQAKTPRDFYKAAYKTSRDPYRNVCIECFVKGAQK